jgi:hypothetical protein
VIPAVPKFESVYLCDRNQKALNELRDFVRGNQTFSWEPAFRHVNGLTNTTDLNESNLQERLKQAIKGIFMLIELIRALQ